MKVYKETNILPLFSYLYFVNIKFMLVCIFMYYFRFEFLYVFYSRMVEEICLVHVLIPKDEILTLSLPIDLLKVI